MIQGQDPEQAWRDLYKWGGISAIILGILGFIALLLFTALGPLPLPSDAFFKFADKNRLIILVASFVVLALDFFFIPMALALWASLKGVRRASMMLVLAFFGLFIVFDLVIVVNFLQIVPLTDRYLAATSDAQRAAYIATYSLISEGSFILIILADFPAALGVLLTGWVMSKGIFSKWIAYFGILTGVVRLILDFAVPGPGIGLGVGIILFSIWSLAIGYKLYVFGSRRS